MMSVSPYRRPLLAPEARRTFRFWEVEPSYLPIRVGVFLVSAAVAMTLGPPAWLAGVPAMASLFVWDVGRHRFCVRLTVDGAGILVEQRRGELGGRWKPLGVFPLASTHFGFIPHEAGGDDLSLRELTVYLCPAVGLPVHVSTSVTHEAKVSSAVDELNAWLDAHRGDGAREV